MTYSLCRKLSATLRFFDLFSYSSFIHYKGQSQFKTATGGFFSIVVLIIFAALFTNIGIKTLQREIISSSFNVDNYPEPTSTTVHMDPKSFMFAIAILKINLNDPTARIFDVEMSLQEVGSGFQFVSTQLIELQPCTPEHFAMTQSMKNTVSQNPQYVNWLCPKINTYFQIFGKFSSKKMKFLNIRIMKCDPSLDPNRPCISDSDIQAIENYYGPFNVGLFFSNPLINPADSNYLDFCFQDSNYMTFSSQLGVQSNVYIQDYSIVTDESIMPYTQPRTQTGIIIPNAFKNTNYLVQQDQLYVNMLIFKSSTQTTYQRSFYKVDEFFSYIGGLVGVILSGMFLLASYNQFNFYNDLAKSLFNIERSLPPPNLWTYAKQTFFQIFRKFFPPGKYQSLQKSIMLQQQIQSQLDIRVILERLICLQRSVQIIFRNGQHQMMHLAKKYTLKQSKKTRFRKYLIRYLNRLSNQVKNISLTSLNDGEAGIIENDHVQSNTNKTEYYQESSSDDGQQIDDGLQNEMKKWIKQFRKSFEENNTKSKRIALQIDESLLRLILSRQNSRSTTNAFANKSQSKQHSLQQSSSNVKVYPQKSLYQHTLYKNNIERLQFIEP